MHCHEAIRRIISIMACLMAIAIYTPCMAEEQPVVPIEELRKKAIGQFGSGEYTEALPSLRKILKLDPGDSTALRHLLIYDLEVREPHCRAAAAAFFEGNYKIAAQEWQEVLNHDPAATNVRNLINEALLLSGRDAVVTLYASARRLVDAGRYNEAALELEKILEIKPGEQRARAMLKGLRESIEDTAISDLYKTASDLRARGEYDLAIEALSKVLKLNPSQDLASKLTASLRREKYSTLHARASLLYRQGRYIKAREPLESLIAALPEDMEIEAEMRRLNQIVEAISAATGRLSHWKAIRVSIFNYISPTGSRELALAAAHYAVELAPSSAEARSTREFMESHIAQWRPPANGPGTLGVLELYLLSALNHVYEGRYGRAVEECSIVLALDSENMLALKRLGSAFYLMGDKERAMTAWQRALSINPRDRELKEFLEMADVNQGRKAN